MQCLPKQNQKLL